MDADERTRDRSRVYMYMPVFGNQYRSRERRGAIKRGKGDLPNGTSVPGGME